MRYFLLILAVSASTSVAAEDRITFPVKVVSPIEIATPIKVETITDPKQEERDNARANRDLQAQESMALWTKWMFWSTVASLLLSVGALVGLFLSLGQTKRAMKDARDVGEAQVRAYLSLAPSAAITIGDDWLQEAPQNVWWMGYFDVSIHNAGNSFALNVRPSFTARMITVIAGQPENVHQLEISPTADWQLVHAQSSTSVGFRHRFDFAHPRDLARFESFRFEVDISVAYKTVFDKIETISGAFVSEKLHFGEADELNVRWVLQQPDGL